MWHVETDFFALAIFFAMIAKDRRLWGDNTVRNRMFLSVLIIGALTTVIDIVSSLAMNGLGGWWFYQISMSLYAGTQVLPTAMWICYMMAVIFNDDWQHNKRRIRIALTPVFAFTLLALTNPATGWFFTLSPTMEYARGPLFIPLGFGVYCIYALAGLGLLVVNRKRVIDKRDIQLMALFFIVSLATILVQLQLPGLLLLQSAYAFLCVLCDATMEERNRRALYRRIQDQNNSLVEAVDKAESAGRQQEEFFSRASHDMRTPLNAITGFALLAKDTDDVARKDDYIDKISISSEMLLSLVNDVLTISRIDTGAATLNLESTDIVAFFEQLVVPVCENAELKKIAFSLDIAELAPCRVSMDRLSVQKVFLNLLSNAVKFTPADGHVTMNIKSVPTSEGFCSIVAKVVDDGIGMSPEFCGHAFEPFMQEDAAAVVSSSNGTGLGLAIVRQLVALMGGSIDLQSVKGAGTTFIVRLRFSLTEEAASELEDAAANARRCDERQLASAHVLLVEDNLMNVEIARTLLEQKGMHVVCAYDGQAGVDAFAASAEGFYDIVLMDIRMPVMDGYAASRAIRALGRKDAQRVPVIAMTADAYPDDVERALAAGMNAHLPKPVDPDRLFQTISCEMEQRQAAAE